MKKKLYIYIYIYIILLTKGYAIWLIHIDYLCIELHLKHAVCYGDIYCYQYMK